tara:strand:- start:258 stop:950 length:693 start_codon:yes stop_codon:yes gene_type:complete
MNFKFINGFKIYGFLSEIDLINSINNKKVILVAMNAEKIANRNTKVLQIVNENMGYADGEGCVLALKQKGLNSIKIPGSQLWLKLISNFYKTKSFYLIGSKDYVISNTVEKLKKDFQGINILGFRNGYLNDFDISKLIDDLKTKKPDIIFVAQGSPKQEIFMNQLFRNYPAIYMGLGGSFDVYSGNIKNVPNLLYTLKLEWLYRIIKNPKRIKRLPKIINFFFLLVFKKL